MEGGKVVNGFDHLIFHSIMSWPFLLAFVPICNDDEKGERSIIE
jgi:hypothetical protein